MGGSGGGGGGSGGAFIRHTPAELQKLVRQTEDKTTVAAFEAKLSGILGGLLAEYNGRDRDLTRERLDTIKAALKDEIDGSFDQLFGGSVAKQTHVEGMSDVDCLVLIDDSELKGRAPDAVLSKMARILEKSCDGVSVSAGRMAVSVEYEDGMLIQILPALREKGGHLHVPSSRNSGWSKINPVAFTEALSRRNEECGHKLVPTVKLAKAIIGQLPEAQRLSGYHMESLGIAAFKSYDGPKATSAMLPEFFERASKLVLSPITDSTGQSVHVDGYLGVASSDARVAASHLMERLAKRMRNASAGGSEAQWLSLFGMDE
jgi:hypothetical protein